MEPTKAPFFYIQIGDYKEFRLIGSIVKHMNNYAAIKYLLNYGYTYNKRKKDQKIY